jgi:predicted nucleotidyltransferase
MKTLKEIVDTINRVKKDAEQRYKAKILGIFGSFSRGEQKETSDVDILVEFHKNATLFDLMGLSIFLQEKLGIDVDIVPQDAVRKELKERINKEVINL